MLSLLLSFYLLSETKTLMIKSVTLYFKHKKVLKPNKTFHALIRLCFFEIGEALAIGVINQYSTILSSGNDITLVSS